MTTTSEQRRRADWLRENITATAGFGHKLDDATLEALPSDLRARAAALGEHACILHASGERGAALEGLRSAVEELNGDLPAAWAPPDAERPDKQVIDQIRRGF